MPAGKRTRTVAPGSRPTSKKQQTQRTLWTLQEQQCDSTLRHTALLKTSHGRRKQRVSLVPLNVDEDKPEFDTLAEETELTTFRHFLDDDNNDEWLTLDENLPKKSRKSETKKKRVLSTPH